MAQTLKDVTLKKFYKRKGIIKLGVIYPSGRLDSLIYSLKDQKACPLIYGLSSGLIILCDTLELGLGGYYKKVRPFVPP